MAEHNQRFDSFDQWVGKASSWLTRRGPFEEAICLDAKNRVCATGGDFMRARDEGAFPIRWLWKDQVAETISERDMLLEALENIAESAAWGRNVIDLEAEARAAIAKTKGRAND